MADSRLVRHVQGLSLSTLSSKTRHFAKRAIIDAVGCALAGARHQTIPGVLASLQEIEGPGQASVWGLDAKLNLKGAVFLNAYAAALFDMDDGHRRAQGHPGAVLVPAALTVAAQLRSSGPELMEAVVAGYDVAVREAVRIREAGGPRKGTSGWCAPGAAAAVGRLLRLSNEQMSNAIGQCEYLTPQAGQDRSVQFPSMTKEGIPWGAYTGCYCAHLAKGGFTAHRPHLADAEDLCADLGERLEIDHTYYKKWAACRWAHPALGGLEALREGRGLSISDVKHIKIRSFEKALLLDNRTPRNTLEAVYSIPFSLAYWLKHGQLEPEDLMDEASMIADPEVCDMAMRIDMEHATEYSEKFPLQCIQDVIVTFHDGTVVTKANLEAPWDAGERAPSDDALNAKFLKLSRPVLGPKAEQLLEKLHTLEALPDVGLILPLLTVVADNSTGCFVM